MVRAAIIEPAITQLVAETRELMAALSEAEVATAKLEVRLTESREAARARRLELGLMLTRARQQLPARGTSTNGWRAYLEAIEMAESTAHRYMAEASSVSNRTGFQSSSNVEHSEVANEDVPPPSDDDAPREADCAATDDEIEIDRDTWCTPKWITEAIGEFGLDPCANERSHVQAQTTFDLSRGEDGLVLASSVKKKARVFINPPYSDVTPWIEAYKHTRFCFLLKVDPSTKWFELLLEHTELVLIPRRTRIQFEAPAGVPPEKAIANQFPHALFYAHATDATDAIAALCFPGWFINRKA